MSIEPFFSVPLLVEDIDPAVRAVIHAKVHAYLASARANGDIEPSPEESVQTSYYKPEAQVLVDAELRELEQFVLAAATTFLETLRLGPRRLEIERSWINLFKPGAQEAQHSHDGSLLSCSYYVEAPKDCGCIVMPRPYRRAAKLPGVHEDGRKQSPDAPRNRRGAAAGPPSHVRVVAAAFRPVQQERSSQDLDRDEPPRGTAAGRGTEDRGAGGQPRPGAGARSEPQSVVSQASAGAPRATSGDAKPFLFNDLFEVRPGLKFNLEPIQNAIPTVVIDDFLKHPEEARDVVGRAPAANWKHEKGGRNFVDYYDCRLRFPIRYPNSMVAAAQHVIRQVYKVATRPSDASVDVNWFMQIHERRADFAVPHNDMTEKVQRSFTCILYLNRREECSGGTAFFRFRKSGSLVLDEPYARAIREDARLAETGLDYWPSDADQSWERVGTIDMAPGRLLIFPSEYFHAAYHPQNSFYEFPRLTLAFWMVA